MAFTDELRRGWDLLAKYPLQLGLPLVIVSLLTTGRGGGYSPSFTPWWLFPVFLAIALVVILIALLVIMLQIVVWLVTFESARLATRTGEPPGFSRGWDALKAHLGGGRASESLSRAWARTEGHRGDLALAILLIVVANAIVDAIFAYVPVVGWIVRGLAAGIAGAWWACVLGGFYGASAPRAPLR